MRSGAWHVIVSAVASALTPVLLAVSLVGGLAALLRMAGPVAAVPDEVGGALRLPPWLTGTIGVVFALAVLVFLLGLARRLRSRREGAGEFAVLPETPPPRWLRALRQVLSFVYFLVLIYLVWRGAIPLADIVALVQGAGGAGLAAPSGDAAVPAPPLVTWTYGALALAAGLGALAVASWVAVGDHLTSWWRGPAAEDASPPPLVGAVAESLEDLRAEPDPRRAIVRCYARFQRVAADSGAARLPWQTPMEFMRDALSRLPAPAAAVSALTGLFELARFSDRPLGPAERQLALGALSEISAAVAERRGDAGAR